MVKEHPKWSPEGYICQDDLNRPRIQYVRDVAKNERDEYASLEGTVDKDIKVEDHLPKNDYIAYNEEMTFGEHVADSLAGFARELDIYRYFYRRIFLLGHPEHLYFTIPPFRSLSIYPA